MPALLTPGDLPVAERPVLLRADLNVPLEEGKVADDFRIRASLPAIEGLREAGAVVVLCSHLGRPKGPEPSLRMDPVAERLAALAGWPVRKLDAVVGPEVAAGVAEAAPGDVLMLENTRFEGGETRNDPQLAEALAALAQYFVLDAFGSAHRAHASTVGVAERLPSAAGPLMHSEVQALSRLLEEPSRPYSVVLGGAKVSDKLGVMRALLPRVDSMLVGGGMCFTLLAAQGYHVGGSLLEEERIEEVRDLLASDRGDRVILPSDVKVGESFAEDAPAEVCPASQIPDQAVGLDIGPQTADRFGEVLGNSGSIFWNGPMGVFEWDEFRAGTEAVARAVAANQRFTVAGGGDTIAALRLLGLQNQLSHLSTGGGAALEFLEGQTLPGLAALEKWADWRPGR